MTIELEDDRQKLTRVLLGASWHAEVLETVWQACGDDAWIGAGFVRNAAWDDLHGRSPEAPEDVDILIHDPTDTGDREAALERDLATRLPAVPWSVRNQARMHLKHGDAPYSGLAEAMRRWPETATAVAVRMDGAQGLWILAPFGLGDLMRGVLRPGEDSARCRKAFQERVTRKGWLDRWPGLSVEEPWPVDLSDFEEK
ncbi:nucleotidyltransferase family protein [Hwanghaeella grinnelliae]|uniref:Nucleotidyltransferase family protein n=1 Tax=Hwanghaeella grinnelliae TaxID=2500179 RepID=A0A437QY86_9PROT|nr:nucleotidyltransferase family protein [Hwanghaeella grinnelliae]RVU39488.1 nucleotidyltransferase family protein [Hwanghaeella grinnelliae]